MTDRERVSSVKPRPGRLDPGFDPVSGGRVDHVVTLPGQVIVSGFFSEIDGEARRSIAGLTSDGEVDTEFDVAPALVSNTFLCDDGDNLYVDARGSFHYPAGSKDLYGGVLRLRSDGSLDTGFNPRAHGLTVSPTAVLPVPEGLLVAGSLQFAKDPRTYHTGIFRLTEEGQYDPSFQLVEVDAVRDMTVTEAGQLVIGGHFRTVNGQPHAKLAVLDTGGELIPWLNGPGLPPGDSYFVHRVLADASAFIVCGHLGEINGVGRRGIAKILADGTIAPVYGTDDNGFTNTVLAMVRQNDGKLIVGGEFNWVGDQRRDKIARLESDGTLDTSFNIGTCDKPVTGLALQEGPDQRYLIAVGSFWLINGQDRRFIARIHAGDGSVHEQEDTPEDGPDGDKKTPPGGLPSFGGDRRPVEAQ